MKKILRCFFPLIAFLAVALVSCKGVGSDSSSDNTTTTDNVVKYVPILGSISTGSRAVQSARVITIDTTPTNNDPKGLEAQLSGYTPVFTGFSINTKYKVGDSFTSTVLGQSVVTTISEADGDVVYTGKFEDGNSSYKIILHSNQTFDFEQNLELSTRFTYTSGPDIGKTRTDYKILAESASGIPFNTAGEYTGDFLIKSLVSRSDHSTYWLYNYCIVEVRSNVKAWAARHLEDSDGSIHYAPDGDFTLSNTKVIDLLKNGDTKPTDSLSAGTLFCADYYYNSRWDGFFVRGDGSTAVTIGDVNGVSQTMTASAAVAYIWDNMK